MANANRRFGLVTFSIVTTAAAAFAVATLAYQPDLDAGSIALSIGTATPLTEPPMERQARQVAVDHVAVFMRRWADAARSKP
ncbi:MAG TPA: hypothetical protein VKY24_17735 [Reyranella sp.]|nr:hypothetical protein [Reyranella sp.]